MCHCALLKLTLIYNVNGNSKEEENIYFLTLGETVVVMVEILMKKYGEEGCGQNLTPSFLV